MSFENYAFNKLKDKYPNLRKNGANQCLREHCKHHEPAEEITKAPFVPDATLLDLEKRELTLFEIEDTHPLPMRKLETIQRFGHDAYDCMFLYVKLVCTDRYGMNERVVWDVNDDIAWTYLPTGEWLSNNQIDKREAELEKVIELAATSDAGYVMLGNIDTHQTTIVKPSEVNGRSPYLYIDGNLEDAKAEEDRWWSELGNKWFFRNKSRQETLTN